MHGAAAATDAELLDPSEIQEIKVIGSGSCGEGWLKNTKRQDARLDENCNGNLFQQKKKTVVKAKWRGDFVACKKIFRALVHGDALQEFMSEVKILRKLVSSQVLCFPFNVLLC